MNYIATRRSSKKGMADRLANQLVADMLEFRARVSDVLPNETLRMGRALGRFPKGVEFAAFSSDNGGAAFRADLRQGSLQFNLSVAISVCRLINLQIVDKYTRRFPFAGCPHSCRNATQKMVGRARPLAGVRCFSPQVFDQRATPETR